MVWLAVDHSSQDANSHGRLGATPRACAVVHALWHGGVALGQRRRTSADKKARLAERTVTMLAARAFCFSWKIAP